jgi:hypothetical protein
VLTDAQCRKARTEDKPLKLFDQRGLFLYVTKTGLKSWRWKFRVDGREKVLTFGKYPEVSLVEAREAHTAALKQRRDGLDPAFEKRQAKATAKAATANTFESMAHSWFAVWSASRSPAYAQKVMRAFEKDVFPHLGSAPISRIDETMIVDVLNKMKDRALDQAHRMRQRISEIFEHAEALGLVQRNPARKLKRALPAVVQRNYAAARTIEEARQVLTAVEALNAFPATKLASRLMALTAVRSEALRHAEPHEFEGLDGTDPIWRIPASKMKLQATQRQRRELEFVVPLSRQAVEVVREALRLTRGTWLFPNLIRLQQPMSENAVSKLYRQLPETMVRHVPHGWRSSFSTIMNARAERAGTAGDRAILELMLAHTPKGVEPIYNRATYMERRRELAQEWADLLLVGMPPASELVLGRKR